MGYACPVCDHPQADAMHLANHLAFTALARGGDHEAWLDETVPEWEQLDEESLGERVTDHASQREYPQVFEDTTGSGDTGDHAHEGQTDSATTGTIPDAMLADAKEQLAEEEMADTEDVLAEARELTRQRREDSETE